MFLHTFAQAQKKGILLKETILARNSFVEVDAMDVMAIALKEKNDRPKERSKVTVHKKDSTCKMVSLLPSLNYTPPTSWSFGANSFISFFTGKDPLTYMSTFNLAATYTLNKQVIVVSRPTIWTNGNHYFLTGDYRFSKYPSYTYGLGPSPNENKVLIDYSYIRFYQTAYRQVMKSFFLGIGYNMDYHYNIKEFSNGKKTDFQTYSLEKDEPLHRTISSGITLNTLYDTRRNSHNPIGGSHYMNVSYRYNSTLLQSDQNWQSVIVDMRKYISLSPNSENVLALWSYNWFTFAGNPPYLDLPSSAWDTYENMNRGYTQGRFRSQNLMDLETEYRFSLTKNRLFGGVVFANVQTISDRDGRMFNVFYPAAGTGFRIKFNKKTDTNIAVDYAIGLDGSSGFFFNLGEVF